MKFLSVVFLVGKAERSETEGESKRESRKQLSLPLSFSLEGEGCFFFFWTLNRRSRNARYVAFIGCTPYRLACSALQCSYTQLYVKGNIMGSVASLITDSVEYQPGCWWTAKPRWTTCQRPVWYSASVSQTMQIDSGRWTSHRRSSL